MSSRLSEVDLEVFSASWRPRWQGPRRIAMLAVHLANPRRFVAYGTDGSTAFRVEGDWRADLSRLLPILDAEGVELLVPPGPNLLAPPRRLHRPRGELTFPDLKEVQRFFDGVLLGQNAA